jgi:hypothetical protein
MQSAKRWFLTPCGLDCSTCTIRLRTKEELAYWEKQHVDPEKIKCDGCRSERSGHHWSPDCKILECCIHERQLEFCAACPDFPCSVLDAWAKAHEHHKKALQRLNAMKKSGIGEWLKKYFAESGQR